MKKTIPLSLLFCFLFTLTPFATQPQSKQATILDASSSAEVIIETTGLYDPKQKSARKNRKDVRKNGVQNATIDAKRTALYFLLFSGTDPILSTDEEKTKFKTIQTDFYKNHLNDFIVYEDDTPSKKVLLNNETAIKITKKVKINRELLINYLEDHQIILKQTVLTNLLGNPFLMVLPQTNENPIEFLQKDPYAKHASGVIESYLTAKKFDVVIPDQQAKLTQLNTQQSQLNNRPQDVAYQLALSIGSDVYIDYNISISTAAYNTKKAAVSVRAYETTTARLLGSETGYSQAREGDIEVSIEEALLEALNNVLNRVMNYWEDDSQNGTQYKFITSIDASSFNEKEIEYIQDHILDILAEVSTKTKEIAITPQTIDYIIWCNPATYNTSRQLWRNIRDSFNKTSEIGTLSMMSQNRKLLHIKIDPIK